MENKKNSASFLNASPMAIEPNGQSEDPLAMFSAMWRL